MLKKHLLKVPYSPQHLVARGKEFRIKPKREDTHKRSCYAAPAILFSAPTHLITRIRIPKLSSNENIATNMQLLKHVSEYVTRWLAGL